MPSFGGSLGCAPVSICVRWALLLRRSARDDNSAGLVSSFLQEVGGYWVFVEGVVASDYR
jgi:hypothetical protein